MTNNIYSSNDINNKQLDDRFKMLLSQLNINLPFNKDNAIEISYIDVNLSVYYENGLVVFYSTFLLEYQPSAIFSQILLATCKITEQPSIQVSNTDNFEITLWSREWLDKIDDNQFFEWIERFGDVTRDWNRLIEEYNSKQELRKLIRIARKSV
ncbi:MAG: hypothetical protein RLZZ210_1494 [Pseudomonadota bacterium]|jgi:hypothetical protein